jgi:hypothetical protein
MIAVLFHGLKDPSEEGFLFKFETRSQQVENSHVGGFQIVDIGVEILIHVFEDAAVLEGEVADAFDMLLLPFHEDAVLDAQGLEEDDGLSVQKTSLVLVPVEDIEVFPSRFVSAFVFYHALPQNNRTFFQFWSHHQNALGSFVPDLDYTELSNGQFKTYLFHEVLADLADTVSVHVSLGRIVIIDYGLLDFVILAEVGP